MLMVLVTMMIVMTISRMVIIMVTISIKTITSRKIAKGRMMETRRMTIIDNDDDGDNDYE